MVVLSRSNHGSCCFSFIISNNSSSSSNSCSISSSWSIIPPRYTSTLLPPACAALSYGIILYSAQIAGRALHVSCATTGWSSLLGCLGVTCSSLAAGQVSFALQKYLRDGSGRLEDFLISKEQAIFHSICGVVAFKVLGGKFQNLMPSDLRKRGALAQFSLPARGPKYATESQQRELKNAFQRDGCHHCGRRTGDFNADHIAPNILVHKMKHAKKSFLGGLFPSPPIIQRLYPQCIRCMRRQSTALLHGNDPFVFHFKRGLPQPPYLAGFLLGVLSLDGTDSDTGASTSNKRRSILKRFSSWAGIRTHNITQSFTGSSMAMLALTLISEAEIQVKV